MCFSSDTAAAGAGKVEHLRTPPTVLITDDATVDCQLPCLVSLCSGELCNSSFSRGKSTVTSMQHGYMASTCEKCIGARAIGTAFNFSTCSICHCKRCISKSSLGFRVQSALEPLQRTLCCGHVYTRGSLRSCYSCSSLLQYALLLVRISCSRCLEPFRLALGKHMH